MAGQLDNLAEVIMRAQRNDHTAYEVLYSRFVDALYRYLAIYCNDRTMAEEVLGEVWLRVVQNLPSFRIPDQGIDRVFSAWLYRIARNLAIDTLRSNNRYLHGIPETIASSEPDLDAHILAQDKQRSLQAALAKLTVEQREVILLRFREERSSAEVAALTGRSEVAVKALQHRALGALARALGVRRHQEGTPCSEDLIP